MQSMFKIINLYDTYFILILTFKNKITFFTEMEEPIERTKTINNE